MLSINDAKNLLMIMEYSKISYDEFPSIKSVFYQYELI